MRAKLNALVFLMHLANGKRCFLLVRALYSTESASAL